MWRSATRDLRVSAGAQVRPGWLQWAGLTSARSAEGLGVCFWHGRQVLMLRRGLAPGDRGLGRQVQGRPLRTVHADVPGLDEGAHQAAETRQGRLLRCRWHQHPGGLTACRLVHGKQGRVPVRVSRLVAPCRACAPGSGEGGCLCECCSESTSVRRRVGVRSGARRPPWRKNVPTTTTRPA